MGTQKGKAAASPKGGIGPKTKGTAQNARRKQTNRPSTRSIVRWNDELDTKLLLSIQSACNAAGLKLPWEEVAKQMGHEISEGAIVQHLAKLRTRMVQAGMEVPPPLRRGGAPTSSKSGRNKGQSKSSIETKAEPSGSEYEGKKDRKAKAKAAKRTVCASGSNAGFESEFEDEFEGSSSASDVSENGEYVAAGEPFLKYPNDNENSGWESRALPFRGVNNASTSSAEVNKTLASKIVKLHISKENLQEVAARNEEGVRQADTGPAEIPIQGNIGNDGADLLGVELPAFNMNDHFHIGNIPQLPEPQTAAQESNYPNSTGMEYPQAAVTMTDSHFVLPIGSWDDGAMTTMLEHVQADSNFDFGAFDPNPQEQFHHNGHLAVPSFDPVFYPQDLFGQRPEWALEHGGQGYMNCDSFESFQYMEGGEFDNMFQMVANHNAEAPQYGNEMSQN